MSDQGELINLADKRILSDKAKATLKRKREKERFKRKRNNNPNAVSFDRFMHHRKRRLVAKRRREARKNGIEFTITAEDLHWPTHCPILGIELDYLTRGKVVPNMPSIDRVEPRLGYHAYNTRVVSFRGNTIKSDATIREIEKLLEYVRAVKNQQMALIGLRAVY